MFLVKLVLWFKIKRQMSIYVFFFVFLQPCGCVWAHWNFGFISQLPRTLALYQGPVLKNVFYKKKNAYGKYLSYDTPRGYVACSRFGGSGIQVSVKGNFWRIFCGFLCGGCAETKTRGPNTFPRGPFILFKFF